VRIAMVGQKTNVTQFGGVERHVGLLAERLAERGHDVTVFIRPRYGRPQPGPPNLQLVERPCVSSKHLEAITHSALCASESALRGYDVVHVHGVGPSLVIPLARARRGAAVISTVHDQDYNKGKWAGFARLALRAGERSASRFADEVIVVARYLEHHLRDVYGREAVYVPNGNDPLTLCRSTEVLRRHGLEPGRYLLFLARLVPEKGCDLLIRAMRESRTPYRLAVVGGSSHSDEHARLLRELAHGDERVAFLGFQSGDALDQLRTHAGAYVMPSRQEGLPLSLLEALWYGIPVIASDIPAVHEVDGAVARDRMRLVPSGDVAALRSAIDHLPYPAPPARPGELDWPTWGDVAERVEAVYGAVLERKHGRRSDRAADSELEPPARAAV
jgi:glycosyltransferase involved in cell wall biosynthesis